MVDVSIVDDGKHERSNGACLLRVQTEIVDNVWWEVDPRNQRLKQLPAVRLRVFPRMHPDASPPPTSRTMKKPE